MISSAAQRYDLLYLNFATPKQQMFAVLDTIPYLFKHWLFVFVIDLPIKYAYFACKIYFHFENVFIFVRFDTLQALVFQFGGLKEIFSHCFIPFFTFVSI